MIDAAQFRPLHLKPGYVDRVIVRMDWLGPKKCGGFWTREVRFARGLLLDFGMEPDVCEREIARFYATCWLRSAAMQVRLPRPALLGPWPRMQARRKALASAMHPAP